MEKTISAGHRASLRLLMLVVAFLLPISSHGATEIFVETIAKVSARDAVTVYEYSLYASNYHNGRIYKIGLDGSLETVIGDNKRGPAGIRFDGDGNMYVAMYNDNAIVKIDPQGNESVFASEIREPIGLDWDTNGNLYVSSFGGTNTVTRISSDGVKIQLASVQALTDVSSLCLDSADNIYVTSYGSGDIYRVSQSGDVARFSTTSATGISFIQHDPINNVFYATTSTNSLLRIDSDGAAEVLIDTPSGGVQDGPLGSATIQSAIGLAVSLDGKHIYFASNTHIRRITLADRGVV